MSDMGVYSNGIKMNNFELKRFLLQKERYQGLRGRVAGLKS